MFSKFKSLRDQLGERWDDLFESSRTWWAGLAPREKLILGSASGLFAAVLVVFLAKSLFGVLSETSNRADSLAENGKRIQKLIQEIIDTRMLAERYDTAVLSSQVEGSLKSLLDAQAARYGVSITEAKAPTTNSNQAAEGDEVLELRLNSDTSLSAALNFLDAVQSKLGVRILHLRVIPNTQDRQKLSIDALISKQAMAGATP
jgi:type II secretory pathway component PulM